jgi:hypothetical protein
MYSDCTWPASALAGVVALCVLAGDDARQRRRRPEGGLDLARRDHPDRAFANPIPQVQHQRQVGRDAQLVHVLGLGQQEPAQREDRRSRERAGAAQPQGAPREQVGEQPGQRDVNGDGRADLVGHGQPGQDEIERIECTGLGVGEERRSQKQIWVP